MSASRRTSRSSNRGFTLVEVLMAMLIMTVGLLGLLQSLQVAYQHNARNRLREEGVLIAEQWMNDFRVRPFDEITARNVVTAGGEVNHDIIAGGRRDLFSVTRNTTVLGSSDSKKLAVTVQWSFRHQSSSHVLYSIKTR